MKFEHRNSKFETRPSSSEAQGYSRYPVQNPEHRTRQSDLRISDFRFRHSNFVLRISNLVLLFVLGVTLHLPASPGLVDTTKSPHAEVESVGLADVQWTTGFWADQFATCRDQTLPSMWS